MTIPPQDSSPQDSSPLVCPECLSSHAAILAYTPPKAKCADCGLSFPLPAPPTPPPPLPQKRLSAPGSRRRQPNGPTLLNVSEAPPLSKADLGNTTWAVHELTAGSSRDLIRAAHEASRLSAKFGEEFEARWLLKTLWLTNLEQTFRGCKRARYALSWRPRYLAAVALTRSQTIAAKAAQVSPMTVNLHIKSDPDFAAQVVAAEDHAVALLHDACFASALEGDVEPVYWQGIKVGHVRKFDSRLRIEMLRAHLPSRFKAPGAAVSITTGANAQLLVIGDAEKAELCANRARSLERIREERERGVPAPVLMP